jgi:two-component system, chemotaxis family, sensor kinase CheA
MSESFDLSGLIEEFQDEARSQLDRLDAALLRLEREGSIGEEEHGALLRGLHTLKGNAGMLGYLALRDYVHAVESVFRSESHRWPQQLLDVLFEGAAAVRQAIDRVGSEEEASALARLEGLPRPDPNAAVPEEPMPEPELGSRSAGGEAVAPTDADPSGAAEEGTSTLRVPFAKLDVLVNRVSELFRLHESLTELLRENRDELESIGLRRPLLNRLETLEQLSEGVRDAAMDLRLVPIRRVFSRFPSLVRELAREQGKRVRVELEGEDTELDKSTIDALGAPLLHLVRNAVDHGIRRPEERQAAGKPAEGTIALRARHAGDSVRVEVQDDGPGLDRGKIVQRAREAGLLGPHEEPEDAEVADLILRPGFSTRSHADTVSGRGIGLNVVAQTAARLRGSLEVTGGPDGDGTRFVLHLPLTLAVVPSLVFESDGEVLALAATDVEETIRPEGRPRVADAEVVEYLDELIPIARPARLFGWMRPGTDSGLPRFVVIVRRGPRSAAVAADRLLEQRDVVVKALPRYLDQSRGVSGASIAPDGRVVLVLDAGGIIDLNLEAHRRSERVG